MEEMTAKEYLNQISVLDARITNLLQEKEDLRNSILPGGVSYHQERVQSSPDPDPYGTWACRMEEKEAEIVREIDALSDLRLEVTRKIGELKDTRYIRVLYLRHVQLEAFRKIADEMGYSYHYIRSLYKLAFETFETRYNKTTHNHTSKCDNI